MEKKLPMLYATTDINCLGRPVYINLNLEEIVAVRHLLHVEHIHVIVAEYKRFIVKGKLFDS